MKSKHFSHSDVRYTESNGVESFNNDDLEIAICNCPKCGSSTMED